ncbi:arsenic resistance protein [Legionella busanensis]|nr:arsenic resistance protein [Legionella busanensis]
MLAPNTISLRHSINPVLTFMLFVTFLQVPLINLRQALLNIRFISTLIITNFVVLPILVLILMQLSPSNSLVRLGILLVLLTPCIDYVVTFSYLGRGDAQALLATTPLLLIIQMLLLPVYINFFLGSNIATLVQSGPFIDAFIWLIALPLIFAGLVQYWASRHQHGQWVLAILSHLPIPATALVLFIVITSMLPQVISIVNLVAGVIPIYIIFAISTPMIGWGISRLFKLDAFAGRAIAFSAGTRNSLVVLPFGLAVPEAIPILPAVIITQTLIELISELIYVQLIAKLGTDSSTYDFLTASISNRTSFAV